MADESAFFDRIRNAPDDDGPRLIYADWLEENGQAERAEFIRLQCALARLPEDAADRLALRDRERELLDAHENRWAGRIRQIVAGYDFHRGVIDRVSVGTEQFLSAGAGIFDLAPVRKVRFLDVGDRLVLLLESRLMRHIRELDFCGNPLGNRGPAALARSRHLGRLDALGLPFTELGDEGLQHLAASPTFHALCELTINENHYFGTPGLQALADSPHLTALATLDLTGNDLAAETMIPFLQGPMGQRLRRLRVAENPLRDAGVVGLLAAPVAGRMAWEERALDLRRIELSPVGARALADWPALEAVESLDLEGNVLGDAGLAAIAASPHLTRLRYLSVAENRISDDGIRFLIRSPILATLRVLDLTGNLVSERNQDRLREAALAYDWRGVLRIKIDSHIRTRSTGNRTHLPQRPR